MAARNASAAKSRSAKASSPRKCARWCGRGCTQAEYDAARTGAQELCARLGKGWRPRVWENLGWHYSAVSRHGYIKIHPNRTSGRVVSYTVFIGANQGGQFVETAKTPKKALDATVAAVREHHGVIEEWLRDAD